MKNFRKPSVRRGFTLLQLVSVIGLIMILSAMLFGVLGRGRAAARRSQCDIHMKEIAMALDTFRQENNHMPAQLAELVSKKYVSAETLRCPSDPELKNHAGDLNYTSYGDGYLIREPRDSGELPITVCSNHEVDGYHGVQAYKGRYTEQFTARPAQLVAGNWQGSVTITRPGQGVLTNPTSAAKPLELRGGDRVKVTAGYAKILFADSSSANITENSEMSILESYIEGQRSGPLYTLTRQFSGRIEYYVNPGSHFDVATPTATAGALGTKFTIELKPDTSLDQNTAPDTVLSVQEHSVALSTIERTIEVAPVDGAVNADEPASTSKKQREPRQRGKDKKDK
ncbi:MAG TPA: FecR domain-containing protein [Abditibacteriaceae bacterium]